MRITKLKNSKICNFEKLTEQNGKKYQKICNFKNKRIKGFVMLRKYKSFKVAAQIHARAEQADASSNK